MRRLHDKFMAYFHKILDEHKWKNKQLYITEPLQWLPSLVVLGYGGYAVLQQQMTLGMFIIVFQFAQQYMESINGAYHQITGLSEQKVMIDRLYGKFQADSIQDGEYEALHEPIRSIRLERVSFSYAPELPSVLADISASLPIGRKIAIVGASGSGKSTLAKLLVKSYKPTSGAILINERPLTELLSAAWFDRVSYVPQEPYLLPDTIEANIRFGRDAIPASELKLACEIAQISTWIETLPTGYETICGERGIQLSGGQRQRIALARAILEHKELLVLDEATSALDQETERNMQRRLDRIRKGKTTLIIAHRLSTILNADTIIVMDHGIFVDQGNHTELMERCAVYRHLHDYELEGETIA